MHTEGAAPKWRSPYVSQHPSSQGSTQTPGFAREPTWGADHRQASHANLPGEAPENQDATQLAASLTILGSRIAHTSSTVSEAAGDQPPKNVNTRAHNKHDKR